jgi:hypothetical protein
MIDFEKWAFRHGLITNESSPMAVHNAAQALRQLAADVLEEAAKEFDVSPHTQWHEHEIAEWLRTRAAELVKP